MAKKQQARKQPLKRRGATRQASRAAKWWRDEQRSWIEKRVLNTANSRLTKRFRKVIPCLCSGAERRDEKEEKLADWWVKGKNRERPLIICQVLYAEAHAAAAKAGINGLQPSSLIIGELFLCWTCFKSPEKKHNSFVRSLQHWNLTAQSRADLGNFCVWTAISRKS